MDKGLARIDYKICINCGKCVKVCPVDVIHDYRLMDSLHGRKKLPPSHRKAVLAFSILDWNSIQKLAIRFLDFYVNNFIHRKQIVRFNANTEIVICKAFMVLALFR